MKVLRVASALACLAVVIYACGQSPVDCAEAIPWHEAPEHAGESVVIEGPAYAVFDLPLPGQVETGTDFGETGIYMGDGSVTVRVYPRADSYGKFRPDGLSVYEGKTVCVRGKIRSDNGNFSGWYTHIDSPDDLKIVE